MAEDHQLPLHSQCLSWKPRSTSSEIRAKRGCIRRCLLEDTDLSA